MCVWEHKDVEVTIMPCSYRGDVQRPRVEDGWRPVATVVIFRGPHQDHVR